MPIEWHPKRSWNFFMSEDEKKQIKPLLLNNAFNVHNLRLLEHFVTWNLL